MTDDLAQLTEYQGSPQGIVSMQVTTLVSSINEIWRSWLDNERKLSVPTELQDIELAYRRLGRLISQVRPVVQEAAE